MSVVKKDFQPTNKFIKNTTTNNKNNNVNFENYQKEELNVNNNILSDLSKEFSNLYKNTDTNDINKINNTKKNNIKKNNTKNDHSNLQRVTLHKQDNKKPNNISILEEDIDMNTNNNTKKEHKKKTIDINEGEIMNLLKVINIMKSLK